MFWLNKTALTTSPGISLDTSVVDFFYHAVLSVIRKLKEKRETKTRGPHSCPPIGLRGVATHQFRKVWERNAPGSVAWEDVHRAQTLKRCRALMQTFLSFTDLVRVSFEVIYIVFGWRFSVLVVSIGSLNALAHAQKMITYNKSGRWRGS